MNTNEVKRLYTKKASFYHFFFLDFLGISRIIGNFLRQSDYVRSDFKILDAGCGTGNITRSMYTIAHQREYKNLTFHAFDLTQAMLDLFYQWIKDIGGTNITLKQADVLHLESLTSDWSNYDLIVSCGMLEYLPKDNIRQALSGLKELLKHDGKLLVFITRHNVIAKLFIEQWWKANTYNEQELRKILLDIGFRKFKITRVRWRFMFIVEAEKSV